MCAPPISVPADLLFCAGRVCFPWGLAWISHLPISHSKHAHTRTVAIVVVFPAAFVVHLTMSVLLHADLFIDEVVKLVRSASVEDDESRLGSGAATSHVARLTTQLAASGALSLVLLHLGELQGASSRVEAWGWTAEDPSGVLQETQLRLRKEAAERQVKRAAERKEKEAHNGRAVWGAGTGFSSRCVPVCNAAKRRRK